MDLEVVYKLGIVWLSSKYSKILNLLTQKVVGMFFPNISDIYCFGRGLPILMCKDVYINVCIS